MQTGGFPLPKLKPFDAPKVRRPWRGGGITTHNLLPDVDTRIIQRMNREPNSQRNTDLCFSPGTIQLRNNTQKAERDALCLLQTRGQ